MTSSEPPGGRSGPTRREVAADERCGRARFAFVVASFAYAAFLAVGGMISLFGRGGDQQVHFEIWQWTTFAVLETAAFLSLVSMGVAIGFEEDFLRYRPKSWFHPAYVVSWPLFLVTRSWRSSRGAADSGDSDEIASRGGKVAVVLIAVLTIAVGLFLVGVAIVGVARVGGVSAILLIPGLAALGLGAAVIALHRSRLGQGDVELLKSKTILSPNPSFIVSDRSETEDPSGDS